MAQITFDSARTISINRTMEEYEKNLKELHEQAGLKRLDVDGFILFQEEVYSEDEDSIPQTIFVIKYPLTDLSENKTLEQNFLHAISKSNVSAYEEIFSSMRWPMPTLSEELKKCETISLSGQLGPYPEGKLKVIYGRIIYTVRARPEVYPPQISSIQIIKGRKKYSIPVPEISTNGYPSLFKALK